MYRLNMLVLTQQFTLQESQNQCMTPGHRNILIAKNEAAGAAASFF